jgi:ABC-type bacteriocin/lantibiotic exporter with double-glycine peptidase domain
MNICIYSIGFVKGWKLTLVVLSISPALFIAAVLFSKVCYSIFHKELKTNDDLYFI